VNGLLLSTRQSSLCSSSSHKTVPVADPCGYRPLAWLLSRALFDIIPLRIIPTILVSTIVYFMVGLDHSAARFFKFLLILVEYGLALTLFVSIKVELV
jgi:hypothetical protein